MRLYNRDFQRSSSQLQNWLQKADLEGHGYKKDVAVKLINEYGSVNGDIIEVTSANWTQTLLKWASIARPSSLCKLMLTQKLLLSNSTQSLIQVKNVDCLSSVHHYIISLSGWKPELEKIPILSHLNLLQFCQSLPLFVFAGLLHIFYFVIS